MVMVGVMEVMVGVMEVMVDMDMEEDGDEVLKMSLLKNNVRILKWMQV